MFSTHFTPKVIDDNELVRIIKTFLKREWPDKDVIHDIKFEGPKGTFYAKGSKFELEIDQPRVDYTIYSDTSEDCSILGEKFQKTMGTLFEKYT